MGKFTATERIQIQSIVATLSIKRIPDSEIIEEINDKLKKSVSRVTLYNVRNRIKKDSFKWFVKLRDNEYEYLHEYRERINELNWLCQKHHELVDNNSKDPSVVQNSLAQLHKLNASLTEIYNYLPNLMVTLPPPTKKEEENHTDTLPPVDNFVPRITNEESNQELVCYCEDGQIMCHYTCPTCNHTWCPEDKATKQLLCPKCSDSDSDSGSELPEAIKYV